MPEGGGYFSKIYKDPERKPYFDNHLMNICSRPVVHVKVLLVWENEQLVNRSYILSPWAQTLGPESHHILLKNAVRKISLNIVTRWHHYVSFVAIIRGVIDMGNIDISITLLNPFWRSTWLVAVLADTGMNGLNNTACFHLSIHIVNLSKYQKHENGHLEKKLRAELLVLLVTYFLHGHASLFLLHSKKKHWNEAGPSYLWWKTSINASWFSIMA